MRAALPTIGLLAAITPALADFTMLPAGDPVTPPAATAEPAPAAAAPDPSGRHHAAKTGNSATTEKHPNASAPFRGIPAARGFGTQIPLSFAVRQIVPPSIKITYGPGTDQASLVDWQGGRRWPIVLRDAVRPLGLRVTVNPNAIAIRK